MSGQEQQIFLPDLPSFGPGCAAGVCSSGCCGFLVASGGSDFEPEAPIGTSKAEGSEVCLACGVCVCVVLGVVGGGQENVPHDKKANVHNTKTSDHVFNVLRVWVRNGLYSSTSLSLSRWREWVLASFSV